MLRGLPCPCGSTVLNKKLETTFETLRVFKHLEDFYKKKIHLKLSYNCFIWLVIWIIDPWISGARRVKFFEMDVLFCMAVNLNGFVLIWDVATSGVRFWTTVRPRQPEGTEYRAFHLRSTEKTFKTKRNVASSRIKISVLRFRAFTHQTTRITKISLLSKGRALQLVTMEPFSRNTRNGLAECFGLKWNHVGRNSNSAQFWALLMFAIEVVKTFFANRSYYLRARVVNSTTVFWFPTYLIDGVA